MMTAYCRSKLTGKLAAYNLGEIALEEIPNILLAIKEELGVEYTHPALVMLPGGKASNKPAMNNNTNEKEPA